MGLSGAESTSCSAWMRLGPWPRYAGLAPRNQASASRAPRGHDSPERTSVVVRHFLAPPLSIERFDAGLGFSAPADSF